MTYACDGLDRLVSVDWAGRIASETISESGVSVPLQTSFAYDLDGALQQVTYPSGLAVRLDRDPATRQVVAVRNASDGTPFANAITHYPGGPLASLVFGNGRTLTQGFNARYEPLTIASGPVLLTYGPSPSGDIGVIWDQSEDPASCTRNVVRGVSYDFADRVSAWGDDVQSGSGVCPAETIGDLQAAYSYVPGTDRVATQLSAGGHPVLAFGYDAGGNVSGLGQYDPTGTTVTAAACLRHDALGRLVLVGTADSAGISPGATSCLSDADVTSVTARFKYDARNRRLARQVGNGWTYVVPDLAGNPLSELALSGGAWTKVRDYVWLDGRLLAQVEYGQNGTPAVYYAHLDHLGMPRALTSASGQLVWSAYQRPNGEVLEKTAPDPATGRTVVTNLRLPGQYDERLFAAAGISGMQGPYYNWNRWYLPSVGRYLEPDPLAALGQFNTLYGTDWYGYAGQNPMTYVDPDGRFVAPVIVIGFEETVAILGALYCSFHGCGLNSPLIPTPGLPLMPSHGGPGPGQIQPMPSHPPAFFPDPPPLPAPAGAGRHGSRGGISLNACLDACAGGEATRADYARRLARQPCGNAAADARRMWSVVYEDEQTCKNMCVAIHGD